jgi:hypothetical protein|tara:strand:- start:74 stop:334 length:261 start_codon:yes stop_codon:yes gene_type:complete
MIDYIKENCQLPPLEPPLYDEDSATYDLWFDEREGGYFPFPDPQLICIPYDTQEEARRAFDQVMELEYNNEGQFTDEQSAPTARLT